MSVRSVMPCLRFCRSSIGVAKSFQPSFELKPFQTTMSPSFSRRPFSKHHSRISSSVPPCSTRYRPSSARRGSCDNPRAAPRTRASASCPTSAGNTSCRASSLSGFSDRCSCGQINPAPRARTCHFFITPTLDPSSRSRLSGSRRCWRRSCSFPACRTARPCRGRSCGSRS